MSSNEFHDRSRKRDELRALGINPTLLALNLATVWLRLLSWEPRTYVLWRKSRRMERKTASPFVAV